MDWIQTYTGKQFRPLAPRREDIDIRDIAHALSLNCRFNGHCRTFYSVGEHAVRVARALPRKWALWGLLHDAGEAYLTDLPRPVKTQMPQFQVVEERLLEVLAGHFGLCWPAPAAVWRADDRLLATEARDLLGVAARRWGITARPLAEQIVPWSWREAEKRFLAEYEELRSKR